MSDNTKINYYEVLKDTPVLEYDETHKVAIGIKSKGGNKWEIEKGKYVKSFGQIVSAKTVNAKENILLLVNGNGVKFSDVKLYIDEVDDCGCDGNPIALPEDLAKALKTANENTKNTANTSVKGIKNKNETSNMLTPTPSTSKFDKSTIIGLILGALVVGAIVWFKTKDKKKTLIGIGIGAFIGLIIGYFSGKRGVKVLSSEGLESTKDIENVTFSTPKTSTKSNLDLKTQEFLVLNNIYDFSVKNNQYVYFFIHGSFYVATNKDGERLMIKPNGSLTGKLVQVEKPEFFILDADTKKIIKISSEKPLPFLDLGNSLFVPLSVTDDKSAISPEELKEYIAKKNPLSDDLYVKGRYAGKKYFNLLYTPQSDTDLKKILKSTYS